MKNELTKIQLDWYNTRFPHYNEVELDNLNEEQKRKYLDLYSLYLNMFEQYLNEKVQLFSLDTEFKKNSLNFKEVDQEDMDFYQASSSSKLKYLYIRNNLYLNRLTENEFDYLSSRFDNNDFSYNQEDKEFIEITFKKIIYENAMGKGNRINLNYGPENSGFIAENNSLILGFRYNIFEQEQQLPNEEWLKIKKQQSKYIDEKLEQLENLSSEKLMINCSVFAYDDFSVKKKDEIASFSK